ncbi:hypothetical protein BOTBODRAFT_123974 [Botryobasidium botryosum FD-172 SS1]|uniref:Metallo-beta-lactamase domain-containing protein n=1 Tax=Botryobasidium botryosum (strain FD-172 SS1) TaxID=930990 RepID=A0A067MXT1_BOTB1|nr:hypothetical protein BOTBODRAFT_123974 [Botryobasidium botryosum FD-172 SS1]
MAAENFDLIFHGTGTSSSLPLIECLTAPQGPGLKRCETCLSTLTPEGKKNIRRNTGAIFRAKKPKRHNGLSNGVEKKGGDDYGVVVVDVGKTFLASAMEWFPKYGLREIDAVVLTHAHADAVNGLDDLRGWTLRGAIQSYIDIYLSKETFESIKSSFPYLVSKDLATGGGDVPEFRWHLIQDNEPFEVANGLFTFTPVAVHHGRVFPSDAPSAAGVSASGGSTPNTLETTASGSPSLPAKVTPYICYGFVVNSRVVYLSDVSHIPPAAWDAIQTASPRCDVLVADCLRIASHISHFGINDVVQTARRLGAGRTYIVGMGHSVTHDQWVQIGESAGGQKVPDPVGKVEIALESMEEGEDVWVRPAIDGLRVSLGEDNVYDDEYAHT